MNFITRCAVSWVVARRAVSYEPDEMRSTHDNYPNTIGNDSRFRSYQAIGSIDA